MEIKQYEYITAIQEKNGLSNRALAKTLKVHEASIRMWKKEASAIPPYIELLIECMQKLGRI